MVLGVYVYSMSVFIVELLAYLKGTIYVSKSSHVFEYLTVH